jgi:sugar/nucleoside kinase (ribokinase family)
MTTTKTYDVTAIGNAIVDVIAQADDALLAAHGLPKGAMNLIDAAMADKLYGVMGAGKEASGGSAGNTIAGIAMLGGKAAYIGKVADDQLGKIFTHDIRAVGVAYDTAPLQGGLPTARSLIFVTPDAQRTMQTFLGACTQLGPEDINMGHITSSKVVYMEGYLWDLPRAKQAMLDAAMKAKASGVKVSLTLSDSFCVGRFRDEFLDLAEKYVDILFANESEILSLYQTDDFDTALQRVRTHCEIAALTRSEKGSVVVNGDDVHIIDAVKGVTVVDTTGAGDAYAAGFLYAYTQGLDLKTSGRLGGAMAAQVISQYGPRAEAKDVKALAAKVL